MSICNDQIFKSIYLKWQKPLQSFLQSKGLGINQASDKVQDCFLKLWNNCSKITVEKAKSYLFTTAVNLQIDQYRRTKIQLNYLGQITKKISFEDGQYTLEYNEFQHRLESAINSMSQASKEVFIMNRFEKKKYKEISVLLNISVKAVEKRMTKALAHLYAQNILKKK